MIRVTWGGWARKLAHMTVQVAGMIPEFSKADRFRKAREHAGLEQAELAQAMGVSRSTVSNVERGLVAVRRITLRAWAMATGVDATWLETGAAPVMGPGPEGYTARDLNPEPADLVSWRRFRRGRAA